MRAAFSDVLKSEMASFFFDLVFPMKLKPLTYSAPETLGPLRPGTVVEAELKKTARRAIVLSSRNAADIFSSGSFPAGSIKPVRSVVSGCPPVSPALLGLLKWMAGYYMVPEGSVLKVMWGGEVFGKDPSGRKKEKDPKKTKPQEELPDEGQKKTPQKSLPAACAPYLAEKYLSEGLERLQQPDGYGAFLLHAGAEMEMEFALAAARGERGVIVTCPERSRLSEYEAAFGPVFGERLCVLHGGLTPARRRLAYARILEGKADVVLGTRVALFAPLKKVSLMVVTGEENENYKNREDVRYGGREVAVMRAWLEKTRVLLSSECPSAESYMNTLKGKYAYIRLKKEGPSVRVVKEKNISAGPAPGQAGKNLPAGKKVARLLDRSVEAALSRALQGGKSALLLASRQGHSVPYCEECGHFERCPSCGTALVFHREGKGALNCHICGFSQRSAPETCGRCGGHSLKPLGAGIERLADEAKELFPMAALEIENNAEAQGASGGMSGGAAIFLGTRKRVSKNARASGAGAAALIHPESAFFQPGFRARERLFAEINRLAGRISPGGALYIQTRMPELFRDMKDLDYEHFMETELEERKTLGYPPFSRMAHIAIKKGGKGDAPLPSGFRIPEVCVPEEQAAAGKVEILGPVQKSGERGGEKFYSFLVKAPSAQMLKKAVAALLGAIKAGKVTVDIDPV